MNDDAIVKLAVTCTVVISLWLCFVKSYSEGTPNAVKVYFHYYEYFTNTIIIHIYYKLLFYLLSFLQIVCLGKYMNDYKKNSVSVNPVMWTVLLSWFCNVLLNILIYKKRRKNEKEDKGKQILRIFPNKVAKSLGSLMVNLIQLSIAVTVSINNALLKM